MRLTPDRLVSFFRHNSTAAQSVAASLVVSVVFLAMGVRIRATNVPALNELRQLQTAVQSIEQFHREFRPPSVDERKQWQLSPEALTLGVPRSGRLTLAQSLSTNAELVGLSNVRVRFATPDTAVVASPRQEVGGGQIAVAAYVVSVEFNGGFAEALTFVNSLPSTVAIQRFRVGPDKSGAHYLLTLAVYETADDKRPG